MTAIAARCGRQRSPEPAAGVARMLAAMRIRGDDERMQWAVDGAALGAAWHAWERVELSDDGASFAERGPVVVTADATLYYRSDLRDAVGAGGGPLREDTAAGLILEAYVAFGDACPEHLEGDFAFALWDVRRHQLLAARDFAGKRPLYYAATRDGIAVASTIGGVLAADLVAPRLNLGSIAADASGLWSHAPDTCYRDVYELPAGHTLTWQPGRGAHVDRHWQPPSAIVHDRRTLDDVAAELLSLLATATHERLAPRGVTAVTLSGGRDSTAVYGAGQFALSRRAAAAQSLHAVSISYPEGDPGREDEFIRDVTARWNATPTWIDVDTIPMFAGARAMARARDEPFAHPYEPWNRTLARAARDHGARVMLDGSGGDQLFQVSGVYLADLFRTGQWIELVRQWRARGGTGAREFAKACIRPLLSDNALELLDALVGGGASRHYLDRAPSPWFRSTFLAREGVLDSERAHRPPLPRSSVVLAETHAFLRYPFFPRVAARVAAYVLDEGVQARSPLLDRRVVAFAAARPWYERVNRNDTKMLLRRSMKGLLPDSVLAPRAYRTGITSGYFRRSLTGTGRELIESLIDARHLADSGAVDPKTLRRAWEYYLETGDEETGVRILFTAQTELWLREHLTPGEGSG